MSDLGTRRTTYSIPDGTEPYPDDRFGWALEQARYLHLQDTALLTFLSSHAWGRDREGDHYAPGVVMDDWSSHRRIAEELGKHPTAIRRVLDRLREAGYITMSRRVDQRGASSPMQMRIWWYEADDAMREEVRTGRRNLPPAFEYVRVYTP